MEPQQLDLFGCAGSRSAQDESPQVAAVLQSPAELSDAALVDAIPMGGIAACRALCEEAARRRLRAAVPALEALCRRFKGFGLHAAVPEQMAALWALAEIGGAEAAATVRRLIVGGVVQGPGLGEAVHAAAALHVRLPEEVAVTLLQHADPAVRADACRCVPRSGGAAAAMLIGLLDDLTVAVAMGAACALGRMGRAEARPALLRALRQGAGAETIEAAAFVADEDIVVALGRIARQDPALRDVALAALEDIDTPRALALLARIRAEAASGE